MLLPIIYINIFLEGGYRAFMPKRGMIRGINRQIIEVCDTGNQYFERALLFVKPEYAGVDHRMLKAQAQNLVRGYVPPYKRPRGYKQRSQRGQGRLLTVLCLLIAGVTAGAVIVSLTGVS